MGLQKYYKKRDFHLTPEPQGKSAKKSRAKALKFVVQEHHASRLHYDFRLEMNGVYKSWAVPKGPSTDPQVKRLAVEVEDHPLEYGKFEGVIPKDQYGAGRVILWDSGEWRCEGTPLSALRKGHIDFSLSGKKLKGRWVLVKGHQKTGDKQAPWFLMKRKDDYAKSEITILSKFSELPSVIEPQLAKLVKEVPVGSRWFHEIKWDGYRTFCKIKNKEASFFTRNGLDWTARYAPFKKAMEDLGLKNSILDGEIVWLGKDGKSDFQGLQNALSEGKPEKLVYYIFDILFLNGNDLRNWSLEKRKQYLKDMLKNNTNNILRYSEHIEGDGKKFFKECCRRHLEGIISKRKDQSYLPGRSTNWVKTKCGHQQEFIIGGYTEPQGSRMSFGALLLGVYKEKKLHYVGKTGTGFTTASLEILKKKFLSLEQKSSPFKTRPSMKNIHWLRPQLVANIHFATWTTDGLLRQAVFHGLREDKPAQSVTTEHAVSAPALTHPDKVLFKDAGITKQELADYYDKISDKILPYISDRPLTLVRCPEGGHKECFYQRHIDQKKPWPWIHHVDISHPSKNEPPRTYIYINSKEGLTSLVQMGSLELHPWNTTTEHLEHPDTIIFDLDPDDAVQWKTIVNAAFEIKDALERLNLKSFVKLSGGKGLHIHVPIQPLYSWSQVKSFAHSLVNILVERKPQLYTANMRKEKRKGKIFIDYLRNGFASTSVVPYGVRNKGDATVALPIFWHELKEGIKPNSFTLATALERLLKMKKDPWKDYWKAPQKIKVLTEP